MPLPLFVRAGFVLAGALSSRSKNDRVGRFVGQLRPGWYRVWMRASPRLAAAYRREGAQEAYAKDIAERLGRVGFHPVRLVVSDPSDAFVVSAIATWAGGSSEAFDPEGLTLLHVEEVEPPEEVFVVPSPAPSPLLDLGLTWAEENAIVYALSEDDNPKHLSGFADTLEPDHPIAAGLLGAKSKLAELRGLGALKSPERAALAHEKRRRALASAGWHDAPPFAAAIAILEAATEGLVRSGLWQSYDGSLPLPDRELWAVTEAATRPSSDASLAIVGLGPTDGSRALVNHAFADLRHFVPGESLDEQARHFLAAIERAKDKALKPALVARLSEELAPRTDTLPLVRGVLARLRAEPALLHRYPGNLARALGVPEVVARAALAVSRDLGLGIAIVDADALRGLDPGDEGRGRTLAVALHHAPRAAVNATAGSLVSPTALQLAYSAGRPTLSNVVRVSVAHQRLKALVQASKAGEPSAVRAKISLDRAEKLLQRQKWVSWYDRARNAATSPRTQKLTGPL